MSLSLHFAVQITVQTHYTCFTLRGLDRKECHIYALKSAQDAIQIDDDHPVSFCKLSFVGAGHTELLVRIASVLWKKHYSGCSL